MLSRTIRPLASTVLPFQARLVATAAVPRTRSISTTTETTETSASNVQPEPAAVPTPTPTAAATMATPETPEVTIPYFVGKNKFGNFGVYHKKRRGGNLKLTQIKMVEGNLNALKEDLRAALNVNSGDIAMNNLTRHILIKGHRKEQVVNFFNNMGF